MSGNAHAVALKLKRAYPALPTTGSLDDAPREPKPFASFTAYEGRVHSIAVGYVKNH